LRCESNRVLKNYETYFHNDLRRAIASPSCKGDNKRVAVDLGPGIPRWLMLVFIAVCGAILIVIGNSIGPLNELWTWLPPTLEGIGIATFSAAILAGTIENWLLSDLAKDVFLTTVGQHLPVEYRNALKSELLRLASYKFFCERQVLRLRFEAIPGGDHLRLTTILEKTVRNISHKSEQLRGMIHIDDWGLDERSRIVECSAVIDGTTVGVLQPLQVMENRSVHGQTNLFDVGSGKAVNLTNVSVEVVHRNQDLSFIFETPILNPVIDATEAPNDLDFEYDFGTNEPIIIQEIHSRRRELKGIHFPLQRMRIHWWPKITG
jgi:hypothetical protein